MSHQELVLRLGAAAFLGSLIGLDRQRSDKAAGMRTHMLVSVGAALVMIVSTSGFDDVLSPGRVVLDPSRVAAQVVSGVGFLGAGLILRRHERVHGLTTAASIWAVAAVGLAAGSGLYLAAFLSTGLLLVILAVIKPLEDRITGRVGQRTLTFLIESDQLALTEIEAILRHLDLDMAGIRLKPGERPGERQVEIRVGRATPGKMLVLVDRLQAKDGIREVAYDHPGD